jgi:ElaB/YqjD/DUF883 family membrane-anchored ribosome-binding protein
MSTGAEMPSAGGEPRGTFESLGRKLDDRPEIRAAEEALRSAREQFEKAQQYCQLLREESAADLRDLRSANASELLDKTLQFVKKNPGVGVSLAALLGFFLGRIFRR